MIGKPAGSPITWRRLRWYGPGSPTEGDMVLTEAGRAAYLVEEVHAKGAGDDESGAYLLFRLELTKLDPADIGVPDWIVRFD